MTNKTDAVTLGSGKRWQEPWETVTSGNLTLSVNAIGAASLKAYDDWGINLPDISFKFSAISKSHAQPDRRPDKDDGAWEALDGKKTEAGGHEQINVCGLREGIALRRGVEIVGNNVTMDFDGLGVLPGKDISNLAIAMNFARKTPRDTMPFVAELSNGKNSSGDLCKNFLSITGVKSLKFTSGAHTVLMEFSEELGEGWMLQNTGDPETSDSRMVATIWCRSTSLQQLRKVNGKWHSHISVSVQ